MMTFLPERHYPKAPVTEAVIDLVTVPAADISVETLEHIRDAAYPTKESVIVNQVRLAGSTAGTLRTEQVGWRFRSADALHIYQARTNGFGVSRLAPYQKWESFSGEARRLWGKYRAATKPLALQRIAVRYINRIEIPLPLEDFGAYLLTGPLVSPHLSQGLSGYLLNLTVPIDGLITAVITQAILTPDVLPATLMPLQRDTLPILLDIDVSQALGLPTTEDAVWERFEYLRKVKNHVFESCITDKTRELFQ